MNHVIITDDKQIVKLKIGFFSLGRRTRRGGIKRLPPA